MKRVEYDRLPMLVVIDTPLVGSNPQTRNDRSAWGRSLGMGGRSCDAVVPCTRKSGADRHRADDGVYSNDASERQNGDQEAVYIYIYNSFQPAGRSRPPYMHAIVRM